ncbi:hypothetical protein F66182_7327 [Fusarium sp. NRRL 66182]|nr:hypothetical protein F66182_7327 [Fusarium sp. NRRL 66182]
MADQLDLSDVEFMTRGYRNRTILVFCICYPFAVIAVCLRFFARVSAKDRFWWDDWLSLAGLLMTGGFCGCALACLPSVDILDGSESITDGMIRHNAKGVYVAELFYYISQMSLKFSILMFYWRVFASTNYIRRSIHYIGACIILWFIASFLVSVFQCIPVHSVWDPAAKMRSGRRCIDFDAFYFAVSIPNILFNFILVLLPIPQVLKLKITTAQKASLILFFTLGGFVVIMSIIRVKLITEIDFATFVVNWALDNSVLWTIVETCCGVVGVCFPSLRPIMKLVPWRAFRNAFTRSYGASHDSKSKSRTGTRSRATFFDPARQRSQWSQIRSTNTEPSEEHGIRKHTRIEVSSIEMILSNNSSQAQLADSEEDSKR